MIFFQFEDSPDQIFDEAAEEFFGVILGVIVAAFIFSFLGRLIRLLFDLSYYNFGTLHDTVMIQLTQDVLLGIAALVALGLLPALVVLIWFVYDYWSSVTQSQK